jgi:XRE family transcriptional regulator, master regulator for biofilm formation
VTPGTPGDRIRRFRLARGWSQRELARRAGVRRAMISDLETNKRRSTQLSFLEKLAVALEMSVGKLVEEHTDDPYESPHVGRAWTASQA